jgi:hypothetical protein
MSKNIRDTVQQFRDQITYKFDQFMEKPGSNLLFLLFFSFAVVLSGSVLLIIPYPNWNYGHLKKSWQFITDPSAHIEELSEDMGVNAFVVGLMISIAGMIITGLTIGFLTETIVHYMDQMRKGMNNKVMETGHFVIIGWNDKVPAIITNCAKSENGTGCVVTREKEVMDSLVHSLGNLNRLKVVTRKGNPLLISDLERISIYKARSIIILADDEEKDHTDTSSIMRMLAVLSGQSLVILLLKLWNTKMWILYSK